MGFSGRKFSRNKVLLFSGMVFITVVVLVRLTFYSPSITSIVRPMSYTEVKGIHDSCSSLLHEVTYDLKSTLNSCDDASSFNCKISWNWVESGPVQACGFRKFVRSDASDLLNGSWVVVGGDSQSRMVVLSLLRLILGPREMDSVQADLFKRHRDYEIFVDQIGLKLDFVWAPYAENLTDIIMAYKNNRTQPDVLMIGSGLWHMLHITDPSDYGSSLKFLRDSFSLTGNLGSGLLPMKSPRMFWIGLPFLINELLNTQEKKTRMTRVMLDAYTTEVCSSNLLREFGGPFLLLDIFSLTQKCGVQCTVDGMHYGLNVYDSAVQIMINALVIEFNQRPICPP